MKTRFKASSRGIFVAVALLSVDRASAAQPVFAGDPPGYERAFDPSDVSRRFDELPPFFFELEFTKNGRLIGLGFLDTGFDARKYLGVAVELQSAGEARAIAELRDLAKRADGPRIIPLCRMLFAAKPGGDFRPPDLGSPSTLDRRDGQGWPLEPIAIVDGIPFLVTVGYTLIGLPEPATAYLDYCLSHCRWNPYRYREATDSQLVDAYYKLGQITKFDLRDAATRFPAFRSQIDGAWQRVFTSELARRETLWWHVILLEGHAGWDEFRVTDSMAEIFQTIPRAEVAAFIRQLLSERSNPPVDRTYLDLCLLAIRKDRYIRAEPGMGTVSLQIPWSESMPGWDRSAVPPISKQVDLGLPAQRRGDDSAIVARLSQEAKRLVEIYGGSDLAMHSSVTVSARTGGGFHFILSASGEVLTRNKDQLQRLGSALAGRYLTLIFLRDTGKNPALPSVAPLPETPKMGSQ